MDVKQPTAWATPVWQAMLWSTACLAFNAYKVEIYNHNVLWAIGIILPVPLFVIGFVFAAREIGDVFRLLDNRSHSLRIVGIVGATVALIGFNVPHGIHWHTIQRSQFDKHLAALRNLPASKREAYCGQNPCVIGKSTRSDVRVAFSDPQRISSDWSEPGDRAIVYNPTGSAHLADDFAEPPTVIYMDNNRQSSSNQPPMIPINWDTTRTHVILESKTGSCESLGGGWFRCRY